MQESGQSLTACLTTVEHSDPELITKLHETAGINFHACFPVGTSTVTQPHWTENRHIILDKWKHRACCKSITTVTQRNVLLAWLHVTRFQALKRLHKRHAWQVRQSKFTQILEEAQIAAYCHDSHKLFQTISKFCPKQPRRRVQLRNSVGSIATPVEELAILSAFVKKIWAGPSQIMAPPTALVDMPFAEWELLKALQSIPATKAVARPFIAGFVWKSQAALITPFLYRALCTWWSTAEVFIPQIWKDAWLLLIPKPGKAPVLPESLRPLALQEPIGKAVIGLLAQKAQCESKQCFASLPFWAYLPHRSTQHALHRVATHCREAKALLNSQKPTPFHRSQKLPSFKTCGAVQLFVDLQRAFDTVSRPALFCRLCEVGVNPRLVQILTQWHCMTNYHVTVGEHSQAMPIGSGVRQGCKAAPWLFNAFLALYMRDVAAHIDFTWLQDHLDFFADDLHVGSVFYTEHELKMILHKFGIILEQLQQHGLTINASKSVILLAMAGTSHREVRARTVTQTADGQFVKIQGSSQRTFMIPLGKKTKYLGCIISYDRMESDTLKHRLSLMKVAFDRLRKWLTAKHGLTLSTRMRLWHTCVVPVLTYGIFVIGLTPADLHKVQVTMFTMIRQILHNHSYRTGMTHAAVLSHWNILHPLALLWHAADSLYQSVTQCQISLPADDVGRTLDWSSLATIRDMLWNHYLAGVEVPLSTHLTSSQADDDVITCEICGFLCQHISVLRRHYTQVHHVTPHQTFVPNPAQHMLNGLPQCKHCHAAFTTWRSFMAHIQRSCQVLHRYLPPDPSVTGLASDRHFADTMSNPDAALRSENMLTDHDMALLRSLEFGPRLQTLLQNRQWTQIMKDRAACQYMAHKCILCGQFVGRAHAMHLHMRTAHPMDHDAIHTKATQLTNMHCDETPCTACGVTFVYNHVCNVWYQISVLLVHGAGHFAPSDSPQCADRLTCAICDLRCSDANSLHLHLIDVHKLVSSTWNASRDSIAGEPACSHCHSLFETMEGLRSHINQGRCRAFNPDAPTESRPVATEWIEACCRGKMRQTLRDARMRQRLTLHCQGCTRTYTRSSDLSQHLQVAHSRLWADAKALTMQMVELYYNCLGCVCNPSCAVSRLNHTCLPFTQLAMQFLRVPEAVFQPCEVLETDLARLFPKGFSSALRFKLEQCLINHDLRPIWHEAELMQALSHQCLLCGCICPTAELALHMFEAHNCTSPVVQSYVKQLMTQPMELLANDCSCFACGQIFNHPQTTKTTMQEYVRQTLVQGHYKAQCPCVLQLAAALTLIHHGRRLADGQRRCLQPGVPGFSQPGSIPGRHPEADSQSGGNQATESPPDVKGQTGRQGGDRQPSESCHADDGKNDHQSGQGPADAEKGRHIHLLLQQGGGDRLSASAPKNSGTMAHTGFSGGIIVIDDTTETIAAADAVPGSHGSHTEASGCTGGVRPEEEGDGSLNLVARSDFPLLGVESGQEDPAGVQKDTTQSQQNASELHGDAGHAEQSVGHPTVPRTPDKGNQQCGSVETPALSPSRPTMGAHASPGSFKRVDIDGYESETPQQDAITLGAAVGTNDGTQTGQSERQGEGQRPSPQTSEDQDRGHRALTRTELMSILAHTVLENPNNWCFANATFHSLLWCMLSLTHFDSAMLGTQCGALMNFLVKLQTQAGNLSQESFFTEVLQCWGPADLAATNASISQQDAAEFIQHWLQLLDSAVFDMRWERRLKTDETVRVMDFSTKYTPICFKFDMQTLLLHSCDLTALGMIWHQVDGMVTSLVSASDCVCVHLDRCVQGPAGIYKCTSQLQHDMEVLLPIFTDNMTDFDHVGYTIVAMMAHQGSDGDGAGHYRTTLRVSPHVRDHTEAICWLLVDDWRSPEPIWNLPTWFIGSTTVAWMVRTDVLHLHAYRRTALEETQKALWDMLAGTKTSEAT